MGKQFAPCDCVSLKRVAVNNVPMIVALLIAALVVALIVPAWAYATR